MNSESNPAPRGSIISVFGTGGGITSPAFGDGEIVPGPASLLYLNPVVSFDGVYAQPTFVHSTYAGAAPSLVNGVIQVNVEIPMNVLPGQAVPITLWAYPVPSQTGITVAVK